MMTKTLMTKETAEALRLAKLDEGFYAIRNRRPAPVYAIVKHAWFESKVHGSTGRVREVRLTSWEVVDLANNVSMTTKATKRAAAQYIVERTAMDGGIDK